MRSTICHARSTIGYVHSGLGLRPAALLARGPRPAHAAARSRRGREAALQKAFKLIDDGIAEGGVLVVSEDGEEEAAAAAIVVGWAMARQGVKFADAPALVAKARPSATLNANFEKQLKVWETWKEFPGVPEWM